MAHSSRDELRQVVAKALADARRQVDDLSGELAALMEAAAAAPPDDEHDAEGSTIGFERSRLSALLDHARSQVTELEAAEGRLAGADFGECEVCGQPIDARRLVALPTTRRCVTCATTR